MAPDKPSNNLDGRFVRPRVYDTLGSRLGRGSLRYDDRRQLFIQLEPRRDSPCPTDCSSALSNLILGGQPLRVLVYGIHSGTELGIIRLTFE